MPRSAVDRAFGFQAAGIVRILLAADPTEVMKALDELGIAVQEPETLFGEFGSLVADFLTAPYEQFIGEFETGVVVMERAIQVLLEVEPPGGPPTFTEQSAASDLDTFIADLQAEASRVDSQRTLFQERFDALEQQTLEDIAITFL